MQGIVIFLMECNIGFGPEDAMAVHNNARQQMFVCFNHGKKNDLFHAHPCINGTMGALRGHEIIFEILFHE